jgi:hypothetical protein
MAHLLHSCPTVGTLSITKPDVNGFFSFKVGGAPRRNALGKAILKYSVRFFNWFHAICKNILQNMELTWLQERAFTVFSWWHLVCPRQCGFHAHISHTRVLTHVLYVSFNKVTIFKYTLVLSVSC